MPMSSGTPPAASTKAATAKEFEATIWSGPISAPGSTSSSPLAMIATRGLRTQGSAGWFIAAASASSAGPDPGPGGQQHVALGEIEPGAADVAALGRRLARDDARAIGVRHLLDQHRVGARRHRRAGEDADRLARTDRTAEPAPGGTLADERQRPREVGVAHGVAVHRRDVGGRLRASRREVGGERAAAAGGERDVL